MNIIVLDTETTGLDIIRHEIIEIALINIVLENKNITYKNKINLKVTPQRLDLADNTALKINGYNEKDWRNSKPLSTYLPTIKKIIEQADALLGQNLIFDLRFIKKTFEENNIQIPKFPKYIDTKMMGMQLVKEGKMRSASMDKMCEHFNIKFEGRAHTALADCQRTISVFSKLFETNEELQFFTFKEPYDAYNGNNKKNI